MTTLAWHRTGLLMKYANGYLRISDLNPEIDTSLRMSRWEVLTMGLRCICAALRP
jgi:hypothetical protein